MRYAVFSDVHSNLEAFEAAVESFKKEKIDKYFFVGDLIGYGAQPHECISLLKSLKAVMVAGNHEYGVIGKLPLAWFSDNAKEGILWTQGVLEDSDAEFLSSLPLLYNSDDITMVHGSLYNPEEFEYIVSRESAERTLFSSQTKFCFIGHSHLPFICYKKGFAMEVAHSLEMGTEESSSYLINVGSIGQPRDGDPRGSYCICDTSLKTVKIKRVSYDIEAAQKKIIGAGLPRFLAERLASGN